MYLSDIETDDAAMAKMLAAIDDHIPRFRGLFMEDQDEIKQVVLCALAAKEITVEEIPQKIETEAHKIRRAAADYKRRFISLETPDSKFGGSERTFGETLSEAEVLMVVSPEEEAARIAKEKADDAELETREAERIVALERSQFNVLPFKSRQQRKPRCPDCGVIAKKSGFTRNGRQRWKCPKCQKRLSIGWRESLVKGFAHGMLVPDLKIQIAIHLLAEGVGIRGAARIVGVAKATISKLHKLIGVACRQFLENRVSGIAASEVEVDEVWTYIFKKEHNKRACEKKKHQIGSAWIYIGIDRASKLIITYYIGKRTTNDACEFMKRLRAATVGEMTVFTDGFQPYPTAVYAAFLYDNKLESLPDFLEHPAVVVRNNGMIGQLHETEAIDYTRACTNGVERFNATLRQGLRRMSRRTHAFSKSKNGLEEGLAIFLCYYNFCKVHGSLKGATPAMKAGLTDHVWTIRELIIECQKTEAVNMETGELIPLAESPEMQRRALTA